MNIIIKLSILSLVVFLPIFAAAQIEVVCPPATGCPTTLEASDKKTDINGNASARLHGQFNITSGKATAGYFRLTAAFPPPVFCRNIYGSDMVGSFESALGTTGAKQWNIVVSGLEAETVYYYCAIASDKDKIYYGDVKKFETLPAGCDDPADCPFVKVSVKPAFAITGTTAYLDGEYSNTVAGRVWFEYDTSSFFSDPKETAKKSIAASPGQGDYKPQLTGLSPNTTYYFRMLGEETATGNLATTGTLSFKTTSSGVTPIGPLPVGPAIPIGPTPIGPIPDAFVRLNEGVEHVFIRQLGSSDPVLQQFGYTGTQDRSSFVGKLAHDFAIFFGYVDPATREEVRVRFPDVAAYVIRTFNNLFFIDEFLTTQFLGTRQVGPPALKPLRPFEYLFKKP
jgi:hypothetical protein